MSTSSELPLWPFPSYQRYVALGDSSTEGLEDPDGHGGYRGWANRLAERLAELQGSLLYANLGVRGLSARQVRERQLAQALTMQPDLASVFAGTNDVLGRGFAPEAVAAEVAAMASALAAGGATVVTFTLPRLGPVMPLARLFAGRVEALNAALRQAADRSGAILVDFERYPTSSDPRLWHPDRLHANAAGHARIAAALAWGLGLPGSDESWAEPLPPLPATSPWQKLHAEVAWVHGYLLPWLWRHARGRSSGDGRQPKRPVLAPLALPQRPSKT